MQSEQLSNKDISVKQTDLVVPRRPLALVQRVRSTECTWGAQPRLSRTGT